MAADRCQQHVPAWQHIQQRDRRQRAAAAGAHPPIVYSIYHTPQNRAERARRAQVPGARPPESELASASRQQAGACCQALQPLAGTPRRAAGRLIPETCSPRCQLSRTEAPSMVCNGAQGPGYGAPGEPGHASNPRVDAQYLTISRPHHRIPRLHTLKYKGQPSHQPMQPKHTPSQPHFHTPHRRRHTHTPHFTHTGHAHIHAQPTPPDTPNDFVYSSVTHTNQETNHTHTNSTNHTPTCVHPHRR